MRDARRPARSRPSRARHAPPARRDGRQRARAARRAPRALGRAGAAGAADPRPVRLHGAVGRAAASTASSCSTSAGRAPARSTARRCSTRWGARISRRRRPPPFAPAPASSESRRQFFGTDDTVADMEDLRQALGVDKWSLDGISYGTYVGERYGLAHPSHVSKLVLDSVVPQVGLTDLGVDEFAAVRRVLRFRLRHRLRGRPRRGRAPLPPRAAAVRRADVRQHRRPDLPQVLERARGTARRAPRQPEAARPRSSPPPCTTSGTRPTCSTRVCTRARCARTGAFPGGRRQRRSPAAPRSCEPPWRGSRPRSSIRSTGGRLRATASCGSACRGRRRQPTPQPHGKLRVPTLLVEGNHDLSTQLSWARQQLALTPHGKLVVVPGAGHSVQSRAVSDVGRRAVARFLLGP